MPLDRQARAYLDRMAALGIPPLDQLGPLEARRNAELQTAELAGPLESILRLEDRTIAGPAGPIPIRVYASKDTHPLPVLVYFHGGGWVVGSLDTHDVVGRRLANLAGCMVVSVDYRLAPEHRYPAAVDDCWAATSWVAENASELGADPTRIAVGGDSAGGNLAAVVARRARDSRGPELALQMLVYPVVDHDFDRSSYVDHATGYGLTRDGMKWYWDMYVPQAEARMEPDASPLRETQLAGLAPAVIVVCEMDVLKDEGELYAQRLRQAGVEARVIRYGGMIHGFIRMPGVIDRAGDLHAELASALREAFREPAGTSQPPPTAPGGES